MGNYISNWCGCACRRVDAQEQVLSLKKKRGCTDVPFLLLFVALLALTIGIYLEAKNQGGDPDRLVRGVDVNNRICGVDPAVVDRPFAAWPDPLQYQVKYCVATCNDTRNTGFLSANPVKRGLAIEMQSGIIGAVNNLTTGVGNATLTPFGYDTFEFLFYCLPDLEAPDVSIEIEGFGSGSEIMGRAIGDLRTSWEVILVGVGVAVVLSFVYAFLLRCFAGVFVWVSLIGVVAGAGFMGYTFLQWAEQAEEEKADEQRVKILKGFGYGFIGVAVLLVLIIIALRKRIKIAVEVVKEASRSLNDVYGAYFFPLVPFAMAAGIVVVWVYSSLHIFSVTIETALPAPDSIADNPMALQSFRTYRSGSGVGNSTDVFIESDWDESLKKLFAVHFFFLLWSVQFVIYFTYFVVAGAVADWYFTERDDHGNKIRGGAANELGRFPIFSSVWRALRYHLGTICFGAAIIATIQFIRALIKYVETQTKNKNNQLQKALFCAIQCCLKCVQCCMDFISKNSFIFTAIYGTSFCSSAYNSFQLLWRNLARVAAITLVGNFLMIIGKALVAFLTAGICGYVLYSQEPWKDELSSPVVPMVLIFILAFLVCSLFMVVFETTIDTIFLCFLVDEEANRRGGNMLASQSLQDIVGKYAKQSEEKAEKMKS